MREQDCGKELVDDWDSEIELHLPTGLMHWEMTFGGHDTFTRERDHYGHKELRGKDQRWRK